MTDMPNPQGDATGPAPGCVLFVIEESSAAGARVAGGTKSKIESLATALNSLLNQLGAQPCIDVAVVGYRSADDGSPDVGCRWGGGLTGQTFVPSHRLAESPLAVEDRVRKIPAPGGIGVASEKTVRFPVWYVPVLSDAAGRESAFEYCSNLLGDWLAGAGPNAKPPLVIDLIAEATDGDSFQAGVDLLRGLDSPGGPPLVCHANLGSSDRIPATLYPSDGTHLPPGAISELFSCADVLPLALADAIRAQKVVVNPGARGLIYNAAMIDLIRFLSMVKAYASYNPPATDEITFSAQVAEETTVAPATTVNSAVQQTVEPGEVSAAEAGVAPGTNSSVDGRVDQIHAIQSSLVLLLVDRSLEDPSQEAALAIWGRMLEEANRLLAEISKRGLGTVETAVLCYGADTAGQGEVVGGFSGPLAGRTLVRDNELADGAVEIREVTEKVSNGIGGLIEITRKKPIFIDLEPTLAAGCSAAFAAARKLIDAWHGDSPADRTLPIVVHLTKGRFNPGEIEDAVDRLHQSGTSATPLFYSIVFTEYVHRSLAYPADQTRIDDRELIGLWQLSDPLVGRTELAAKKPAVSVQSRGFVVNGKFDLLIDAIEAVSAGPETDSSNTGG